MLHAWPWAWPWPDRARRCPAKHGVPDGVRVLLRWQNVQLLFVGNFFVPFWLRLFFLQLVMAGFLLVTWWVVLPPRNEAQNWQFQCCDCRGKLATNAARLRSRPTQFCARLDQSRFFLKKVQGASSAAYECYDPIWLTCHVKCSPNFVSVTQNKRKVD